MKKILYFFTFYLLPFTFTTPAFAQLPKLPTSQLPEAKGVVEIQAFEQVFSNILTVATTLAGLAVFIMLISGGFKWLTSSGDPKKVEAAKGTITSAILGVTLLILIWLILIFVEKFTNIQLTTFKIPKQP